MREIGRGGAHPRDCVNKVSILYLRCCFLASAIKYNALFCFNSLFEMHYGHAALHSRGARGVFQFSI